MTEFLCRSCGEWCEGEPMLMDVLIGVVEVCRSCWDMAPEAEEATP